jgi:diguanylate cyclase (GGDEF)-like protein
MLDIDHFKQFNDTYGHDAGDALLRALGQFLQINTRGEDIACRYGGEEFTLVLPGALLGDTRQRAEELRKGISALTVRHLGQPLVAVTISLGVAVYPEHGNSASGIMKAADIALYQAKQAGRNQVVIAALTDDSVSGKERGA